MMRRRNQFEYEEQFRGGRGTHGQYFRGEEFSQYQEFFDDEYRYYRQQLQILWSHRHDPDFRYYQQQTRRNLYGGFHEEERSVRSSVQTTQRPLVHPFHPPYHLHQQPIHHYPHTSPHTNPHTNPHINPYPYPYPYTTYPSTYHSQVNPYTYGKSNTHHADNPITTPPFRSSNQHPLQHVEREEGLYERPARAPPVRHDDGMKQGCFQTPERLQSSTSELKYKTEREEDLIELQNGDLQRLLIIVEEEMGKKGEALGEGAQAEVGEAQKMKSQAVEAKKRPMGRANWVREMGQQKPGEHLPEWRTGALIGSRHIGSTISQSSSPLLQQPGDPKFVTQMKEPTSTPTATETAIADWSSGLPQFSRFSPTGIGDSAFTTSNVTTPARANNKATGDRLTDVAASIQPSLFTGSGFLPGKATSIVLVRHPPDLKGKSTSSPSYIRVLNPKAFLFLAMAKAFGVVGIMNDEDVESINGYFSKLQWLAVPFFDSYICDGLNESFEVIIANIEEYAPIVYTLTVGLVCQNYSGMFRRPSGMYFGARGRAEMMSRVYNWLADQGDMTVVTDGSRILGLGVQGIRVAIGEAIADMKLLINFAEEFVDSVRIQFVFPNVLALYIGIFFKFFDRGGKLKAICGDRKCVRLLYYVGGISHNLGGQYIQSCGSRFGDAVNDKLLKEKDGTPITYEGKIQLLEIAQVPYQHVNEFKSIPSIIKLDSLKVFDDVWFGVEVVFKGNIVGGNGEQVLRREQMHHTLEIKQSLRFFLFQYGIVSKLHATGKDLSLAIRGFSWLVLIGVVMILKVFIYNSKRCDSGQYVMQLPQRMTSTRLVAVFSLIVPRTIDKLHIDFASDKLLWQENLGTEKLVLQPEERVVWFSVTLVLAATVVQFQVHSSWTLKNLAAAVGVSHGTYLGFVLNVNALSVMRSSLERSFIQTNEQRYLAVKCAEQFAEIKHLKDLAERLEQEKQKTQVMLEMYVQESYENRDLTDIKESERRAHSQAEVLENALDEHFLELRVRAANEAEVACQRRLSTAEAEIAELRAKLDASERDVIELREAIESKDREAEAYILEIETIGQAYEDMQTQNQHLLQQVTERDDYNIKLVSESVKSKQAHSSLLSEKQMLVKQLQQVNTLVESLKSKILQSEEQIKACLIDALKSTQEDRILAIHLESAKLDLADAEKELKWLKSAYTSSEKEYEQIQRKTEEVKKQLEIERAETKKLEEELAEMNKKIAEMTAETGEAAIQKLQDEIKECKSILRCGVCFDRPKEVVLLKCYHLFCNQCIVRNLEIRHRKCPGCGTPFGQNDVKFVKI